MGFSRQEYWSGLPFPSAEDLPNPGMEPRSPALYADTLLSNFSKVAIPSFYSMDSEGRSGVSWFQCGPGGLLGGRAVRLSLGYTDAYVERYRIFLRAFQTISTSLPAG